MIAAHLPSSPRRRGTQGVGWVEPKAKPNKEPYGLRVLIYEQTDKRRPMGGLLGFPLLNPTYCHFFNIKN